MESLNNVDFTTCSSGVILLPSLFEKIECEVSNIALCSFEVKSEKVLGLLDQWLVRDRSGYEPMLNLWFWRIVRRLYRKMYKSDLPRHQYLALIHLAKQYKRPLYVDEAFICGMWAGNHSVDLPCKLFDAAQVKYVFKDNELKVNVLDKDREGVVWTYNSNERHRSFEKMQMQMCLDNWYQELEGYLREYSIAKFRWQSNGEYCDHECAHLYWHARDIVLADFEKKWCCLSMKNKLPLERLECQGWFSERFEQIIGVPHDVADDCEYDMIADAFNEFWQHLPSGLSEEEVAHLFWHETSYKFYDFEMRVCCGLRFHRKIKKRMSVGFEGMYENIQPNVFREPVSFVSKVADLQNHDACKRIDRRLGFKHSPCSECSRPTDVFSSDVEELECQMMKSAVSMATEPINRMVQTAMDERSPRIDKIISDAEVLTDTFKKKIDKVEESVDMVHETIKSFKTTLGLLSSTFAPEKLDEMLNNVSERVAEMLTRLGRKGELETEKIADTASESISTFFRRFTGATQKVFDGIGKQLMVAIEIYCLWFVYDYLPGWLWYCLLAYRVMTWFELTNKIMDVAMWLYGLIPKQYREETDVPDIKPNVNLERMETQGWLDNTAYLGAATVFGAIFMGVKGTLPSKNQTEDYLKTFDAVFRINRGIEHVPKFIEKIQLFIEKSFGYVFGAHTTAEKMRQELKKAEPGLLKWAERVSELSRLDVKAALVHDSALRDEILKLRDLANKYVTVFSNKAFPRELMSAFQIAYKEAMELGNVADHAKHYKSFRYDPFCVYFSGGTRVGKSLLCTHLGLKMTANIGAPLQNAIYARSKTKHLDAYTGNPVFYIDDIGQSRGGDAEIEQWNEFVNVRANAAYIVPQAGSDDKGRVFESKIVLCSSNVSYPNPNVVNDRSAILSRRHLLFYVLLDPKFRVRGMPSPRKMKEALRNGAKQFSWLRFVRMDPLDYNSTEPVAYEGKDRWTYDQMVEFVLKEQKLHHEIQNELVDGYDDMLRELIEDAYKEYGQELTTEMMESDEPTPSTSDDRRSSFVSLNPFHDDDTDEEFEDADTMESYEWTASDIDGEKHLVSHLPEGLQDYTKELHKKVSDLRSRDWVVPDEPLLIQDVEDEGLRTWLSERKWFNHKGDPNKYVFTKNDLKFLRHFEADDEKRRIVQVPGTYADNSFFNWLSERVSDATDEERYLWYSLMKARCKRMTSVFMDMIKRASGFNYLRDGLDWYWKHTKSAVEKVREFFETHCTMAGVWSALKYAAAISGIAALAFGFYKVKKYADKKEAHPCVYIGLYPDITPVNKYVYKTLDKEAAVKYVAHHNVMFTKAKLENRVAELEAEICREHEEWNSPEMGPSGDQRTSRAARVKVVSKNRAESEYKLTSRNFFPRYQDMSEEEIMMHAHAKQAKPERMTMQSSEDQNAIELRNFALLPALYRLTCTHGVGQRSVIGLALDGQNLLLPYHFVDGLKVGTVVRAQGYMTTIAFALDPVKVKRLGPGIDAAVIRDIPRLPVARKLSSKFVSEKDLAYYQRFNGELIVQASVGEASHFVVYQSEIKSLLLCDTIKFHQIPSGENVYVCEGFHHGAPTIRGDCGAVLVAHGSQFQRKLLGIHVSGYGENKNGGVVTLVTQEMLDKALIGCQFEEMEPQQGYLKLRNQFWSEENPYQSNFLPEGYIEYGKVQAREAVFNPSKTDIKPSVLHDLVRRHETEPSVLTTWDPRNERRISPFKNALVKYTKRTEPFPPDLVQVVYEKIKYIHEEHVLPLRDNIGHMSMDMAINGCEIDHYDGLNMDSSPGLPWVKQRPQGAEGKKWLFTALHSDGEMCNYYPCETLQRAVMERLTLMLDLKLPFSVWQHCLKDERRKMQKIYDVSTRIFTMAPVDLTILGRMFTMDFVAAFIAAHSKFYSAVGIDPYSPQWTRLYERLRRFGTIGGDGDYAKYDGILDADLIDKTMSLIADWYDKYAPEGTVLDFYGKKIRIDPAARRRILKMFGIEFVHTWQLVLDILHKKCQGNPSGNWLTVILNSIVGEFLLLLCWLMIVEQSGKLEYFSCDSYMKNVSDAIFGDDNMFVASNEVLEFFNPQSLSDKLAEFGIEYTSADKTGASGLTDVRKLRFLKCGFIPHENYPEKMKANLDKLSIAELTNWIRKCPDELAQCREQCYEALRFSYYHGFKFYDELRRSINKAIDEAGNPFGKFGDEYCLLDSVFLDKFF
jgi:hypothetical protein